MSEMLEQVRQAKEEARHMATTGEGGNPNGQNEELPRGASAFAEGEEDAVLSDAASEETPESVSEEDAEETPAAEPKKLIRIGEHEFESEAAAFKYAEELERKTEAAELYNQGVRDALAANARPAEQTPEPEDNFEERFYANPKEALKEVQSRARDEALSAIRAEQQRERLWTDFMSQNPDLRRKDAERVLQENWETIGRMTDVPKAMKVLAQKTRAEYAEIMESFKPRVELKNKTGAVANTSGGSPNRVTQQKKDEAPLDFVSQFKAAFKR